MEAHETKTSPTPEVGDISDSKLTEPAENSVLFLTLSEAINQALRSNRNIENALDNVTGAHYTFVSADSEFELKIIPAGSVRLSGYSGEDNQDTEKFGLEFSKNFSTGTRIYLTPGITHYDENYETSIDAFLVQPLLRGLSTEYNLSGVRSAEYGERTASRTLYRTRVTTMLNVVRSVYNIVHYREILRLNEESAGRLEGHVEAARVKEQIGLSSPIDVYRAEIQLNQALETLNIARESYLDAIDELKIILNFPIESGINVNAPLDYRLIEISPEEAIGIAIENRVEIEQARDALAEAERLSRVAKHGILPLVDLELNYKRYGEDEEFCHSMDFDKDSWGVGLVAEGDLWRTSEKAQYQLSLLAVKSARRRLALWIDEIQKEVKRTLRELTKSAKSIDIQKEQIHQSEGKLELSQVKFSHGLASNFDLIESERELLNAQSRLLGAVTHYIVSTYRLKAALGTLMEKPPEW